MYRGPFLHAQSSSWSFALQRVEGISLKRLPFPGFGRRWIARPRGAVAGAFKADEKIV